MKSILLSNEWDAYTSYHKAEAKSPNVQLFEYMAENIAAYYINKDNGSVFVSLDTGVFFTSVFDEEKSGTLEEVVTFLNDNLK